VKSTKSAMRRRKSKRMEMSHHRRRIKAMVTRTMTAVQHSMMKYMIELLEMNRLL